MNSTTTIKSPERPASAEGNFYHSSKANIGPGMNDRIQRLRKQSVETQESLSIERALITTRFYRENHGKYSEPVMRALNFLEICKQKTIYIGALE
ncbi:MAG TPA: pyruvate formate lyase family protein, partial [Draconibacterium sp.]|nr:pyruvate formate lyase family protein [Draconibacterium sp.]